MVDQVDERSHDRADARALPAERVAPGIGAKEQRIAPFRAKDGRIVKLVAAKACPRRAKRRLDQLYFNSGTWRRVFEMAVRNSKDEEFIPYNVMTYLGFYNDGERGGRPFESWSGSLAV